MKDTSLTRALWRTSRYHCAVALGIRVHPRKLRIGLTNRCNSRCVMCNAWRLAQNGPPPGGEISIEEIEKIAKVNANYLSRLTRLSLTGGEPTLRSDLVDVIAVLTRLFPRCSLNINTNGFLPNRIRDVANQALDIRGAFSVYVSLDGMGEAHNRVRNVPGAFDKTMASLKGLLSLRDQARKRDQRLSLEVNFVATNFNCGEMLPVFEFCQKNRLGFTPIHAETGELYNNEDENAVALTRESADKHAEQMEQILLRAPSVHNREIARRLRGIERDFDCWAGTTIALIEDDTNVYPNGSCPASHSLGRLRDVDYSFDRLLSTKHAKHVLAHARTCRDCLIPCESNHTLRGPEALAGWRKQRALKREIAG